MATIEISAADFDALTRKVRAAARADLHDLLDQIGQQQEDSARRRIATTKQSPGGERWAPWSPPYARTRGSHHSPLLGTGHLRDSLTHQVEAGRASVLVGSNMVYAGTHLFGRGPVPARPYLDTDGGFADPHDRDELRDLALAFLDDLLR